MSELNVEIVKRALDAFNDSNVLVGPGDPLPWLREFCDAGIELDLSRRGIDPEIYHGYEGFLRFRAQYSDAWEWGRFDVNDVIDAGDSVVLLTHNTRRRYNLGSARARSLAGLWRPPQGADARLTQDQQARSAAWRGQRQTRVRGGSSPISLR
jgi:hypothetical protein